MPRKQLQLLPVVLFTLTFCTLASAQNWKEVINEGVGLYAGGPVTADSSGNLYGVNSAGGNGQCYPYGCGQVYQFQPHGHKPTQYLYSFSGTSDGSRPYGRLIFDAKGNIYGVARSGGDLKACGGSGCGVVYELSPGSSGWTQTVLHNFEGGNDGISPDSIIFDGKGNLFGVTVDGGGSTCPGSSQCGTVFELSPNSSGGWSETILHSFTGLADGSVPTGSLLIDSQGNL